MPGLDEPGHASVTLNAQGDCRSQLQRVWNCPKVHTCVTATALSRAARSAAMLTRLARSAPLKPGVPRAMTCDGAAHFGIGFCMNYEYGHMSALTRFETLKPKGWRLTARSTSVARGTFLKCDARISVRPLMSGLGTWAHAQPLHELQPAVFLPVTDRADARPTLPAAWQTAQAARRLSALCLQLDLAPNPEP